MSLCADRTHTRARAFPDAPVPQRPLRTALACRLLVCFAPSVVGFGRCARSFAPPPLGAPGSAAGWLGTVRSLAAGLPRALGSAPRLASGGSAWCHSVPFDVVVVSGGTSISASFYFISFRLFVLCTRRSLITTPPCLAVCGGDPVAATSIFNSEALKRRILRRDATHVAEGNVPRRRSVAAPCQKFVQMKYLF